MRVARETDRTLRSASGSRLIIASRNSVGVNADDEHRNHSGNTLVNTDELRPAAVQHQNSLRVAEKNTVVCLRDWIIKSLLISIIKS